MTKTLQTNQADRKKLGGVEMRLILVMGCLIAMISMGVRSSFGLFVEPINADLGWPYSFFGGNALAWQNLMWGLLGTFAAIVADRRGPMPVIITGALLYAVGVIGMSMTSSPSIGWILMGLVAGGGIAATGFTLVAISFSKLVPPENRTWAMGLGTAAASFGQFSIGLPVGTILNVEGTDWRNVMLFLGILVLLIAFMALAFRKAGDPAYVQEAPNVAASEDLGPWDAIRRAMSHRGYLLLFFGFFVCGFHIAIIYIYLPGFLGLFPEIPATTAAQALGIVGIFNIVGAYSAGVIGDRFPGSKRLPLAWIYLLRSLVILGFVLLPVTMFSTWVFAALMGLLWLSTVPLTSGIIARQWGARYLSTLYGLVFFSHQVGSFAGAKWGAWVLDSFRDGVYVGPAIFEPLLGLFHSGFTPMWWSAIAMGVFAFVVHLPIDEKPVPAPVPTPTASGLA